MHFVQPLIALFIAHPNDLEGTIPLDGPGCIVVDSLAGTGEQTWRGVVFIHDQIGVGLIALKRHSNDHLTQCRPSEGVRTAESLRPEKDVNTKSTTLPDNAIKKQ